MGVVSAIVGSAVLGAVTSGAAANKAAKAQGRAADASTAESRRQYDQTREDFSPYRQFGENAMANLENPAENFYKSPGYDFVKSEGLADTQNLWSMSSPGGNAMKALNQFNSNLASTEFGNWYGRQMQGVQVGSGANANMAAQNQQQSSNISNAMMQKGNAQAQGYMNAYSGINNALQAGIGNYMYGKANDIIKP